MDRPEPKAANVWRNPTVIGIGVASFFSDVGHEMATAVMPAFLRSLGASAAILGAIEGIADALLSASKLAGGVLADRPHAHRRRIAAVGYLVTGIGYGSFAFATSWFAVALGRAVSWTARGVRTPSREALLSGSVPPEQLGRAFGLERASDSTGAILGPLIAAALLLVVGFKTVFLISVIPAVLAAMAILLLTKEAVRRVDVGTLQTSLRELASVRGPFRRLLLGTGLYGLGNFSVTLLILRATDVLASSGRPIDSAASIAVLLFAVHNAANAIVAYPAGAAADRVGRRQILIIGIALFAGACVGFAFAGPSVMVLGGLFAIVGASAALVDTGRGSHAAEILHDSHRGRGFGLLGLVDGIGDLVSSVVVGVIWTVTAPGWGFVFAGALAAAGAAVLAFPQRVGEVVE